MLGIFKKLLFLLTFICVSARANIVDRDFFVDYCDENDCYIFYVKEGGVESYLCVKTGEVLSDSSEESNKVLGE